MKGASTFTPRDAGLLVLLALMWGNSFLFVKTAVASVPPTWIVAGRLTVGGLLLLAIVAIRRQRIPTGRRDVVALTLIGVVGTSLPWAGQAWAQQFIDSGLMAVLNAATPVATLIVAVAVGLERLYTARIVGLAVAVLGSMIVIGGEINAGAPVWALVVGTLAPFGYGLGSVMTRREVSGRIAPLPAAATQLVAAAVVLNIAAMAIEGTPPAPATLSLPAAASLLALGVFGTGLAFIIYFTLIQRVGATNASMVTYLVPIVGLAAGALVRGERFGLNVFLGAAVLIAGVYLAQRQPAHDRTPPPAAIAASRPPASG